MVAPSLRVAGTRVDGTGTSVSPSHPSGIQADDIVLLHAFFHEGTTTTTGTWSTPSGFTLVRKQNLTISSAKKGELALFWKRASGGETGSVTVSRTGGSGNGTVSTANMTVWQDCVRTGDPWEGLTSVADETPPYTMSVTTTGVDRLAVAWVFANDNVASTGTDANWTNVIAPYTDTTGPDYAGHVASRSAPTANSYSGSWSQSAGIEGALVGLAFIGRNQYDQAVSGSVGFTGAISKAVSRSLSASVGFTGAIAKSVSRALTATLGFTGAVTKRTERSVAGSVSFTGTVIKQTGKGHTATVTFTTSFSPELLAQGTPALVIVHIHTE